MGHCRSLLILALTTMVWSFGLDIFRPVRNYVIKRKHFRRFRRMLKDNSNIVEKDKGDGGMICPSCRLPFDKGKKRRLTDTCGHQRCYSCIFTTDVCPLCQPPVLPTRRPNSSYFAGPVQSTPRPNTISVDSQHQLIELARQHKSPSSMIHQVRSRWTIGGRSRSTNEIAKVEIHSHMDVEVPENKLSLQHPRSMPQPGKSNPFSARRNSGTFRTSNPTITNSDDARIMLSMSSKGDQFTISQHSLRSREQSLTSLMSISSKSSIIPVENLNRTSDERSRLLQQRFSIAQNSNISLDNSSDISIHNAPEKAMILPLRLKPLYFEVPQSEPNPPFLGRHWIFREIEKTLVTSGANNNGIVLIGGPGTGKTSLILQLVDYSSFGRKWEETFYQTQDIYWKIKDRANAFCDGDQMSVSSRGSSQKHAETTVKDSVLHRLASKVVGYHFCQSDYNSTCLIPDFIHSLAAQLCQAPQLIEYRDLLLKEPRYQCLLSLDSCLADPSLAFQKGILEPLKQLNWSNSNEPSTAIIVLDSIDEAEIFNPSAMETIASFISSHVQLFPRWLKLIITVNSANQNIVSCIPLHSIFLDMRFSNTNIQQDLLCYIQHRVNNSMAIQRNINAGRKDEDDCTLLRFAEYLSSISKGSFLYVKLTLDLLQQGHLVIKSSSFSVIPVSLKQVFMLTFNLKFASSSSFEKVCLILQICLAALYPPTILEVYHSLNARHKVQTLSWFEFLQELEILTSSQILVHRQDGSLMISHPSLRQWLTKRDISDGMKFLCDLRQGHTNIALRMARLEAPLSSEQALTLGYHLLEANMFSMQADNNTANSLQHLQGLWFQHCLLDTSASLSHERNIFAPNIKINRLLLQAGANPNVSTGIRNEISLLNLASDLGHTEFVSLLLEFGANSNIQNPVNKTSPLMLSSRKNHKSIVHMLIAAGAEVHMKDIDGKTALYYASEKGYLEIVKYLTKCQWPNKFTYSAAANSAFVSAAGNGHLEVCQYLLSEADIQLNTYDTITGHIALTHASLHGHADICSMLLQKGALTTATCKTGIPPIIWAVRGAHLNIVELLLNSHGTLMQKDKEGKTPLLWASSENNTSVLKSLLDKGASVGAKDFEGSTALAWACAKNQVTNAEILLDHKAEIESMDKKGQTPIFLAIKHKDGEMVNLLLKYGANMEHKDNTGNSSLEEAVKEGNITAVSKLLHHGVKLGPKVWSLSQEQPNMLLVLLHKLLSDGVVLYKKEKLHEAAQRFQYALKKFPSIAVQKEREIKFQQLKFYLQLGLSRCNRKMKEYEAAILAADEALLIQPKSYEALYVRAKAKHESGRYQEALLDVTHALHVADTSPKILQTLQCLRADILTSSKVVCPLDGIETDSDTTTLQRRYSSTSTTSETSNRISQAYKAFLNRTQNKEMSALPEKKLTFCVPSELLSTVH